MLVDLHRHLDGSMRPSTLHELADAVGVVVPSNLAFSAGMGLEQALERFRTTVGVLQSSSSLRRVASEIFEDAFDEGVELLELRFAPHLHGNVPAAVDAVLDGLGGRAGLILCALYGDALETVDELVDVAATRNGVVAIDLAGAPQPNHRYHLRDYGPVFRRAAALGIGRTVHAGEGRPAAEIRVAVEDLFAQRIGHGTTLLSDPSVLELVINKGVTIEVCLSSNFHTGAIGALAEHPLPAWMAAGVKASLCTDNTLLSSTNTRQEYERARLIPGMSDELIRACGQFGRAAAFRR